MSMLDKQPEIKTMEDAPPKFWEDTFTREEVGMLHELGHLDTNDEPMRHWDGSKGEWVAGDCVHGVYGDKKGSDDAK